jgi:hypothetical protein
MVTPEPAQTAVVDITDGYLIVARVLAEVYPPHTPD